MINTTQNNYIDADMFFSQATIGILVTDSTNTILMANPFLLNQLGYTKEEVTGRPVEMLLPQSDDTPAALRKDGSHFPVVLNRGEHSTPQGVLTIIHVIEAPNTKAPLPARQQKRPAITDGPLQSTRSLLNNLWTNAGAMVIVTNKDGYIKWFNPAAERILGYKASEVIDVCTPLMLHDQ